MFKRKLIIITIIVFMINCLQIQCFAFDAPTFYITDYSGYAGDEIEVEVRIENNPGIISCLLLVNYDSQYLSLIEAQPGDFEDVAFGPIENNPFSLTWSDGLHDNNTNDGCLTKLKFKINDNAPIDSLPISLSYDPENVFNFDEENVYFDTADGIITVKNKDFDENDTNNSDNTVIDDTSHSESTNNDMLDSLELNSESDTIINESYIDEFEEHSMQDDKAKIADNSNMSSTDKSNSATGTSLTVSFAGIALLALILIAIKKK